jgi:hypothetical protein
MKFDYFYKKNLSVNDAWADEDSWDVLISGFNASERIKTVFDKSSADLKIWLVFPHYGFAIEEYPLTGDVYSGVSFEESEYLNDFFDTYADKLQGKKICIDITGFMRPHLIFLVKLFQFKGIVKFDVIYSDPIRYQKKDDTNFSAGPVKEVRPVAGYDGIPNNDSSNDILLLGVGYDHELLKQVAEHKDYANTVVLWGFPSLKADMYQESVLRASLAPEAAFPSGRGIAKYFSSASDPFATAAKIQEIVETESKRRPITNLYLSPLSTKAQALGFAIYHLYSDLQAVSIIFPFADGYDKETSTGVSSIWKYTVEIPPL